MTLLPDIPRGLTWTPEHRLACEARWLRQQPPATRLQHLAAVKQHRGKTAAARLRALIEPST